MLKAHTLADHVRRRSRFRGAQLRRLPRPAWRQPAELAGHGRVPLEVKIVHYPAEEAAAWKPAAAEQNGSCTVDRHTAEPIAYGSHSGQEAGPGPG